MNKVGFERADTLIEKAIKAFEGIYRAYNNDVLSYEDVLNYIDDNPTLKGLFTKYILEKVRDKLENFDLSDYVDIKGYFNLFRMRVDELIDGFAEWLFTFFEGE